MLIFYLKSSTQDGFEKKNHRVKRDHEMDTTVDIRKKIHAFIDHADEEILKIINEIISIEGFDRGQKILDSFYEELDRRKEKHLIA